MLEVYKYKHLIPSLIGQHFLIERDKIFWKFTLHFYVYFAFYSKYHFYPLHYIMFCENK